MDSALKQRIAEFVAKREKATARIFKATRHALYGPDCLIYMIPYDAMTSPETHRRQHSDAIFFEASANDAVPLIQDLMREIERMEGEAARTVELFAASEDLEASLTVNILRHWPEEKRVRFSKHLIGDQSIP